MAVDQSDLGEVGGADAVLAHALAQAVREVGRSLATDPRRVQGMVSDVLGVQSRTRRAEIDAVVLAAEESVPEDLLAGRIDVDTALDRLHDRGLDAGVAHFAVEVWRYALGMLADDAEPPSLTNSLQATTNPTVTDPAPDDVSDFDLGGVGDTVIPVDIHPVSDSGPVTVADATDPAPATVEHAALDGVAASGTFGSAFAPPLAPAVPAVQAERSRPTVLIAAAAVVALAVIAGLVFVLARGGGDELEVSAGTTAPATTTATSAPATTVPATTVPDDGVAEAVFDAETTPHGQVTRVWEVADGQFIGTLTIVNTTGADVPETRHYEVIPKSIVESAASIVSVPTHVVVKDDPVIAWDIAIPLDGKVVIVYQAPVEGTITDDTLTGWKAKQLVDAEAFRIERESPPVLTVNTPNDTVITTTDAALGITVDPTATLTINGYPVVPNPDGTYPVTGLAEGSNPLTITATSPYGVAATSTLNIIVQLPTTTVAATVATTVATTVAPTPTTRPSGGGGGGGGSPGTTTTPPATTTTTVYVPPPPPPDPFRAYISADRTTVSVGCTYNFYFSYDGPAPTYIDWSSGSTYDGQYSASYYINSAGTWTISVSAGTADGQSDSASISVTAFDSPTC